MNLTEYNQLRIAVIEAGYEEEIEWARTIEPCSNSIDFMRETCWVIINSGMKEQIARKIWERIQDAWNRGIDIRKVFNHDGKVKAIKYVREEYGNLFCRYVEAVDKIAFLLGIPYIGKITVYHLAKNLGHDCAKPDRHLVRISAKYGETTDQMCKRISEASGDKVSVVDTVIWRACNLQII